MRLFSSLLLTLSCDQAGKKKVKAITRAIQKSNRSPSHPSLRRAVPGQGDVLDTPVGSHRSSSLRQPEKRLNTLDPEHSLPIPVRSPSPTSRSTPSHRHERQPLRVPGSRFSAVVGSYGSILASPPQQQSGTSDVASLELPDPAIDLKEEDSLPERYVDRRNAPKTPSPVISRNGSNRTFPANATRRSPSVKQPSSGRANKRNTVSGPSGRRTSQLLKRVLSYTESPEKFAQGEPASEFDRRQDEFFEFLDTELAKIESFYQMKEEEATQRLKVLREQLHTMRDQRMQEVFSANKSRNQHTEPRPSDGFGGFAGRRLREAFSGGLIGKNSKALAELDTPFSLQPQDPETIMNRRDFTRQPEEEHSKNEVPYRSAKRKLKYALQEFYRGVELLKSYAYLNRTAFRKINKKYDKAVDARPSMRYMSDKVNKAWFVQSEVTESLLAAAEDLYARYFERGNRKIAASKLRHTYKKSGDYSPNTFRSGLLLMAGVLFAIQSLIYASQHLKDPNPAIQVNTSYLLQVSPRSTLL
ncbi:hypothetical protein P175DRAFT_075370 [Aspergillus ochraceoroseus IBT 24754]|uniref:SPX domain-containing protein n=1 Tax=Aspergillus ochraceoroseus IBT 24754 TaxID=1392256 RepID=A0A2T5M9V9_9EURO|nr:uncharacterized protein P175DRAFT_075370 [Aspergillus ochraceoroseus IBT 24754]PTU25317.1 hypothetical protein P175DRAFT_075370 [Aspergillus ochraceoroseus IBT 24754]